MHAHKRYCETIAAVKTRALDFGEVDTCTMRHRENVAAALWHQAM
jgi:hypothetical protein